MNDQIENDVQKSVEKSSTSQITNTLTKMIQVTNSLSINADNVEYAMLLNEKLLFIQWVDGDTILIKLGSFGKKTFEQIYELMTCPIFIANNIIISLKNIAIVETTIKVIKFVNKNGKTYEFDLKKGSYSDTILDYCSSINTKLKKLTANHLFNVKNIKEITYCKDNKIQYVFEKQEFSQNICYDLDIDAKNLYGALRNLNSKTESS
jgi:hypothetical protein